MGKYNQDIFGAARFNITGNTSRTPAIEGIPGKRIVVEGISAGAGATAGDVTVVGRTSGKVIASCGDDTAISGMVACGGAGEGVDVNLSAGAAYWTVWGRIVSGDEPVLVNYDPIDTSLVP